MKTITEDRLTAFAGALREQERAPSTVEKYLRDTRAFAAWLGAGAANSFTDVDADAYYAAAVDWAVENGVTNGTSTTAFSPDEDCTRGQTMTFLYRSER